MPVSYPSDLPEGGDGRWPLCGAGGFRSAQWGDLEVGYTSVASPTDVRAVYEGLPGRVCPCPHYGYVFSGRLRCVYPDSDYADATSLDEFADGVWRHWPIQSHCIWPFQ